MGSWKMKSEWADDEVRIWIWSEWSCGDEAMVTSADVSGGVHDGVPIYRSNKDVDCVAWRPSVCLASMDCEIRWVEE